jgi:hypothetical protein
MMASRETINKTFWAVLLHTSLSITTRRRSYPLITSLATFKRIKRKTTTE